MEQSINVASNRPSHSHDSSSTSSHHIQLTDSSLFKTPKSRPQRSKSNDAECSANPRDSFSQSHVLSTPRNRSTTTSAHTPVGSASAHNRAGSSVGQLTPRRSSLSSISSPLPLAPTSALSTPQCGHTVVPVRRRFPGPAGILPPLVCISFFFSFIFFSSAFPIVFSFISLCVSLSRLYQLCLQNSTLQVHSQVISQTADFRFGRVLCYICVRWQRSTGFFSRTMDRYATRFGYGWYIHWSYMCVYQ